MSQGGQNLLKLNGKKIVITGGAGFLGSNLVGALSLDNAIVIIDNFSSGIPGRLAPFRKNPRIKIVKGDIRDKEQMIRLVPNADLLYHLAALPPRAALSDPGAVHAVNVTGTLNILQAALKKGIKRFVYISSSYVYGNAQRLPVSETHPLEPTNIYGAFKVASEKYVKSFYYMYGLPVIIVRPFNTYGPGANYLGESAEIIPRFLIRALYNVPLTVYGSGEQSRDFTYISDTIRGIVQASACDSLTGEEVNIARGEEVKVTELIEIIRKTLKKTDILVEYQDSLSGDVSWIRADISKAKKYFDFKPRVSIEEGIKKYASWLKRQRINRDELI